MASTIIGCQQILYTKKSNMFHRHDTRTHTHKKQKNIIGGAFLVIEMSLTKNISVQIKEILKSNKYDTLKTKNRWRKDLRSYFTLDYCAHHEKR